MNYQSIIDKYYPEDNELRHILMVHSRSVADKALAIVDKHPEFHADRQFVEEAAMLHDIGIFRCDAPGIHCHGTEPYICHGPIGAELLRAEGFPRHARVCERHTGAGLSLREIEEQNLPVPHKDLLPETIEEQIICYADKFFSKTRLTTEKTLEQATRSLYNFGNEGAERFIGWSEKFA
ncbi:MAG: HDIG domain-containing protein [Bacteroidaceae bacterium]|nr:HDIG domain-containing protein [Bacteroidaceae bacterium]